MGLTSRWWHPGGINPSAGSQPAHMRLRDEELLDLELTAYELEDLRNDQFAIGTSPSFANRGSHDPSVCAQGGWKTQAGGACQRPNEFEPLHRVAVRSCT